MLRHDRQVLARSERAEYAVIPDDDQSEDALPPIAFCVRTNGGIFTLQDYLTPGDADALADALREGARRTRELRAEGSA